MISILFSEKMEMADFLAERLMVKIELVKANRKVLVRGGEP